MLACQRRDFKLNRNVPPAIYNQSLVTQRPISIVNFAVAVEAMNNGENIGAQQNLNDEIVELNDENSAAIEAFVVGEIHQETPAAIEDVAVGEMVDQNIMNNINIVAVAANGIDEENFVADDSVATVDNEIGVDPVLNEAVTGDAMNEENVATNEVDAMNQEVPIVNEAISTGTVVKSEVVITRAALREINEILLHSEHHESSYSRENDLGSENMTEENYTSANNMSNSDNPLIATVAASATEVDSPTNCEQNADGNDESLPITANLSDNPLIATASASAFESEVTDDVDHVITFYDSDEEEFTMTYKGHSIPIPYPVPITFIKRENDRISGDKAYEDEKVNVICPGNSSNNFYFCYSFPNLSLVESILPARASY